MLRKNEGNKEFKIIRDMFSFGDSGDLLITKDVLAHCPNADVEFYFTKIVPRFKYTLVTGDILNWGAEGRPDIEYGGYMPLDMRDVEPKELLWQEIEDHGENKTAYIIP